MNARGSDRERRVADQLRSDGWIVYRSAGSHGNADLVALRAGCRPLLIQVKSSRRPFEHFRPPERLALAHEAIMSGAIAKLVHWPVRGRPRWYDTHEWPSTPGIPGPAPIRLDDDEPPVRHLQAVLRPPMPPSDPKAVA